MTSAIVPGTAVGSGTVTAVNEDGTVTVTMADSGRSEVASPMFVCAVDDVVPILNVITPSGLQGIALQPLRISTPAVAITVSDKAKIDGMFRFVQPGDDLQAAIDAVSTAGGGIIMAAVGLFTTATVYEPKSNVTVRGCGMYATTFKQTTNSNVFASAGNAFSNFAIEDCGFIGTVNQTVSVPTRARTTSGPGTTTAISIDGSLDTGSGHPTSPPVITNFSMRNCSVRNCSSLPIRIFGVTGRVLVTGCDFTNNQDVGFGFNQEVICTNNHAYMSADNGFSLSRGNLKVVCTGNTAELCCYDGIWLSGFTGDVGPRYFSCTGNTITNVGYAGISLKTTPKFGVVSGNMINQGGNRGPVDGVTDVFCCGIYAESAQGVSITGNTIFNAPRAGIYVTLGTGVLVGHNLTYNVGTHFLADGTTAIASSSTSQNVGVLIDASPTDISVDGNLSVDERTGGGNYLNWGVIPASITGSVTVANNTVAHARN